MQITSIKDEKIVIARSLQAKKGRISSRCFLVEGKEQLEWVKSSACKIKYVLLHEKESLAIDAPIYTCSDGILKKVTDTNYLYTGCCGSGTSGSI